MLTKVVEPFREAYLSEAGCSFDRAKLGALIDRVMQRGPSFHRDSRQLLQCMAISIFERQCHSTDTSRIDAPRLGAAPLPLVQPAEWGPLSAQWAAPPTCASAWHPSERVRLRKGVEILMPVGKVARERYSVVIDGSLAGQLETSTGHPWLGSFLRNIGSSAAAEFTVQDWIDEFETTPQAFFDLLNILSQRGVILPAQSEATITAGVGGSTAEDKSPLCEAAPLSAIGSAHGGAMAASSLQGLSDILDQHAPGARTREPC
jgi:hypothetical protein